jgi:hypothetical protein
MAADKAGAAEYKDAHQIPRSRTFLVGWAIYGSGRKA